MRGLLALMSGPPVVTLLPHIVLPSPQIGDDGTEFGDQGVGRRVPLHWPYLRRCVGVGEHAEDME